MMSTPALTIYNFPPIPPKWDRVGVFYIAFAATWTAVVAAGMAFCWYNRHLPILRVRELPLAFTGIIFLHLYWIMAQLSYPVGATMPIVVAYDTQYFVMGTWFPLGIALFHASNLRFLRTAELQRQFADSDLKRKRTYHNTHSSLFCRMRNMDYNTKVMTFIIIGAVIQMTLTVVMWVACRKYHPSFGFPGTEIRGATVVEQLRDLGIGWEWWPSVVWQFIWTWGVAPYLIWKAWGIRDTMGWRTQTIGTCLSGLHATPMFLIASYLSAFYKVNMYFHPSQWIHVHTMILTAFVVFIPAYEVIKLWHTMRRVAYSNDKWETSSQATTIQAIAPSEKGSSVELVEKDQIFRYISGGYGDRLLTMTALNRVLQEHPTPLQEFSAYSDFSGENIAFLTRLSRWKTMWTSRSELDPEQRIDMFNAALNIYIDFISPRDAEFPLNLSYAQFTVLEAVFESSARTVYGEARVDLSDPFVFELPPSRRSDGSETALHARYTGDISEEFGLNVFDEAEVHIKDLVLTNTWPKFVREMQNRRRRSADSDRSGMTNSSEATVVSRVSRFVRSLV